MFLIARILLGVVAALHIYFLILEMFLWTKPKGLKIFRMTLEQAKDRAVLAANQGLYNGFLAAGLIWSLVNPNESFAEQIAIFFLSCVIVAAFYGGYSVGRKILYIQGVPALLTLITIVCF
jgi:putative membrane protein